MNRNSDLSKEDIIRIFRNNFPYPIIDTPLGEGIMMPSRDAFVFCNVTGAGYLDNFVFPFTPKGLMKLFYNAFDYKFVSGLFENTTLRNTPLSLSRSHPFLFDSAHKYIVPVEFSSERELQNLLESKMKEMDRPTDYIVMRVEKRKKGNGLESFMEYLAAEFFKRHGYIVENQIPLSHSVGSPDFGAFDLPRVRAELLGKLPCGFHVIELAMLRLPFGGQPYKSVRDLAGDLIVGEAKTGTKVMDAQLRKYLDTGLFDFGFEIHPSKRKATRDDRGMFTLGESYELIYRPAEYVYEFTEGAVLLPKNEYVWWLENYMKFYLLANLTNDELAEFYEERTGGHISDQKKLSDFVISLNTGDIVDKINFLCNGAVK